MTLLKAVGIVMVIAIAVCLKLIRDSFDHTMDRAMKSIGRVL